MKAWGLVLSIMMICGGCAAAPRPQYLDRYGGPPLADPVGFDRAETDVIRGFFASGRQPDGNTVVFASSNGLIVFDTGRHPFHTQKIVDLANARGQPIAAIINSHWHLDHISGNILLRKMWPGAAIYSNDAALSEALGSFLQRGLESNRRTLADPATPPGAAEDARLGVATVEQGAMLHPTVSIESPRTLVIGSRKLEVHTTASASAGDLWLFDPATRLLASGDIITLPAPFLDTACPANWRAALDAILTVPFARAIPGHGREMTRADVTLYRDAFAAFLDCAASAAPARTCAEAWTATIAPLLDAEVGTADDARVYSGYYVENVLRRADARPDWCAAQ